MSKRSPLRRALVAAVVSLALAGAGACGSSRNAAAAEPRYEIVNLMPTFFAFWDYDRPAATADTARLVRLFRERVVQPHAEFYASAAGGPSDTQIVDFLRKAPDDVAAMRAITARLDSALGQYARTFAESLPDFSYDGRIYFYPSLYTRDGGTLRSSPFSPATLMFGVDVIANLRGADADIGAIVHHELFHIYQEEQRPFWRRPKALYALIWNEGVASYASRRLGPQRSDLDILLGDTALLQFDRTQLPRLAAATLGRLDDESGASSDSMLVGGRSLPGLPPRSGYLIGLRVAERIGAGRSLRDLARLHGEALRGEMQHALRELAQASSPGRPQ